jgi:phytoene dehydrogenase-like protein
MRKSTQQKAPRGRSFRALVFGDTAPELEQAALDEARAFFGNGTALRVVPDYEAMLVHPRGALAREADGKKYQAYVSVQAAPAAQARLCGLLGRLRARVQAGRS